MPFHTVSQFFQKERLASTILILATLVAMVAVNSPFAEYYNLLHTPNVTIAINDAAMAFFFLTIGIEIKEAITKGSSREWVLPLGSALGGIAVPALLFVLFNHGSETSNGWAIPTATDIAFSLSILSIFGSKVPTSLRAFLLMVAVIDDIAGVLIIAFFYGQQYNLEALAMSVVCILLLFFYNRFVTRTYPFLFISAALWVAMLDSGIHAALSGVIVGIMLPAQMGEIWHKKIHAWVTYGAVPAFAFMNAGISGSDINIDNLTNSLPLGIAIGLFIGKQAGIFGAAWIIIRCKIATLPKNCRWRDLYAVSVVAGIGFTMSLFIGTIAFPDSNTMSYVRMGVITGSLVSVIYGAILLSLVKPHSGDKL